SRASRSSSGEGHVDIVVDAIHIGNAFDPFGAALEQLKVIKLLEGVLVHKRARDVLYDGDDGYGCFERLGKARDQQGGCGAILCSDVVEFVGDAGISVGHDRTGVLGAVANLANAVMRRGKKQSGRNGLTEDYLDAMPLECSG